MQSIKDAQTAAISTHALREEGDMLAHLEGTPIKDFYPRPPRGGRLVPLYDEEDGALFSTHALREEGDPFFTASMLSPFKDFYPRPPRGGRLGQADAIQR